MVGSLLGIVIKMNGNVKGANMCIYKRQVIKNDLGTAILSVEETEWLVVKTWLLTGNVDIEIKDNAPKKIKEMYKELNR